MTTDELYNQILGLTHPWRVKDVSLSVENETVHVYVEHDPSLGRLCCDMCGQEAPGYDTQEERYWRHLDTCQFMTYLVCSIPRVECPTHGVRPAKASWTAPSSRFTLLFETWAIRVLLAAKVQSQAAKILRLSPEQMHRIMERAVERGLARRNTAPVKVTRIAIDEKSIGQGHNYATIVSDSDRGVVLDLVESRTTEATTTLLKSLFPPSERRKVKSVSVDMWEPFAKAVEAALPNADVAHDRFHVSQHLNEAVDETRRAEHARFAKEGTSPLVKSRYVWLKNPKDLTPEQTAKFVALLEQDLLTGKVWSMKDTFRDFFECKSVKAAKTFFENWYDRAVAVGSKPLTKVANMLKKHLDGLLAVIKHRVTNAIAEAINSKIQALKASARGYRKFANYRNAILFYFGGLQLYPQLSR